MIVIRDYLKDIYDKHGIEISIYPNPEAEGQNACHGIIVLDDNNSKQSIVSYNNNESEDVVIKYIDLVVETLLNEAKDFINKQNPMVKKERVDKTKKKVKRGKVITKPTIKQQKFIENYLESGNATQSVIKAGYNCKSKNIATAIGSENLLKPYIKVAIEERVKNAKAVIYKIAINEKAKEADRIKAAQDIIDRVEGKALARTEHSGKLEIVSETELLD